MSACEATLRISYGKRTRTADEKERKKTVSVVVKVQRIIDENKWLLYIFFSFFLKGRHVELLVPSTVKNNKLFSLRLFKTEETVV